jgi:hypothetical protein
VIGDLVPKNRREVKMAVAIFAMGFLIAFGLGSLSKFTGLNVEPQELTDCRGDLRVCGANLGYCSKDVEDKEGRIAQCWGRMKNGGAAAEETP